MKKRTHHDIIVLWAQGHEVEVFRENKWIKIDNPEFYENERYRISTPISLEQDFGKDFSSSRYSVGSTFYTINGTLVKITGQGSATVLQGGHRVDPLPGRTTGDEFEFSTENGEAICHKNNVDSCTYASFRGLDLIEKCNDNKGITNE